MKIELNSYIEVIQELVNLAEFSKTCCDKPEDRMWHAADNTWWKRVGNDWKTADPPAIPATQSPSKKDENSSARSVREQHLVWL